MVLPLLPIAMAGAGAAGGFGLSSFFGGGKKEIHAAQEYYAPTITTTEAYAHYHPRLQFAPVTTYSYQGATNIIGSPGATSKKQQTTDVESKPHADFGAIDYPTEISGSKRAGEGTSGTNIMHLAIIGAVALVAVTVIGKGKKK